jgi:hypothetical protein
MPEEIELETKEQQEEIEEHLHGVQPSHWARYIPLSTALLAVLAAYAALESGSLVNEALIEQGNSVAKQAQASDQWAYYQAKGVKANVAQATSDVLAATPASATAAARYRAEAGRYKDEQKEIETKAHEIEKERDERSAESAALMRRHHTFAYCVTFAQVAIALSAIAALTRNRVVWFISLGVGIISACFLIGGFLLY